MSLLMDALRKAEQAKRQAQGLPPAPPMEPTARMGEPATTPKSPFSPNLPKLPKELAILDDEFSGLTARARPPQQEPAAAAPQTGPQPTAETARQSARNVFAAKQPLARTPSRAPLFYLALGAATLLAVVGVGIYFWKQLQPAGGGLRPGAALQSPPSSPAVSAPPIQTATVPGAAPTPQAYPNPPAPPATPARPAPPASLSVNGAFAPKSVTGPAASDIPTRAQLTSEPPPAAAAQPVIPIRITSSPLRVNSGVAAAYQAFQAGDLKAARSGYEQVLKSEPKNSDALHGLAALSLRQGQVDAAEPYYLRALEADPKDAMAQSGLIDLKGQADPVQAESRLKSLLADQPDAPFLHFSLGNLYARQGRWAEAQQAYFKAWSGDAENPDYLFNLAVSLDQLRQPRLALQYYRNALAAAASRPAAFDRTQVAARVHELQQ